MTASPQLAGVVDDATAIAALERATDDLFYAHGIAAVTVAAVRDASGISLRRIYSLCGSKADLISLWLRARHRTWTTSFSEAVAANISAGRTSVDAVFDALTTWMVETEFRGCGFINTHAESSELTEQHLTIIQEHKSSLAAYLDTVTGHGNEMALLVDGAIVHAAMFSSIDPIESARQVAHALMTPDSPFVSPNPISPNPISPDRISPNRISLNHTEETP